MTTNEPFEQCMWNLVSERLWTYFHVMYNLISALFWDFMQHGIVVLYRHFGTTDWCHLQGSNSSSWTAWPLKKGSVSCPEMCVRKCYSTLHKIPEEQRCRWHPAEAWNHKHEWPVDCKTRVINMVMVLNCEGSSKKFNGDGICMQVMSCKISFCHKLHIVWAHVNVWV